MNKKLSLTAAIFGLFLFIIIGCREEQSLSNEAAMAANSHAQKNYAPFSEVLRATSLKNKDEVMAKTANINSLYDESEYVMDTSTIRRTLHDGVITEYAIGLKKKNETEKDVFYNLVFSKKGDIWKKFLVKLIPEYVEGTQLIKRYKVVPQSSKVASKSGCNAEFYTFEIFSCFAGHTDPYDGDCQDCWFTLSSGFVYNCDQEELSRDFGIGGDSGGGGINQNADWDGMIKIYADDLHWNRYQQLSQTNKWNSCLAWHNYPLDFSIDFFYYNPTTTWAQFQNWFVGLNGDNLTFNDNTINSNNSFVFNNYTELNNFLNNNFKTVSYSSQVILNDGIQKIMRLRVNRMGIYDTGINIEIKLKKQNNIWTFDSIHSEEYIGAGFLYEWSQSSFTNSINTNPMKIEVYGYEKFGVSISGINIKYKNYAKVTISINPNTGEIISANWEDLPG